MDIRGYKTYAGLLVMFLGMLGLSDLVSPEQSETLVKLITSAVGLGIALYGNYKAHKEIKAMGGYRPRD